MVKFLSFSTCGGRHYGVLKEDGIVDLSARMGLAGRPCVR